MELITITEQNVTLDLLRNELHLLCNTLNEVCNGINLPNFSSKIGMSEEDADILHDSLIKSYHTMMEGVNEYLDFIDTSGYHTILTFSKVEMTSIRNALNEICIDFCESEFQTRLGTNLKDALVILEELDLILKNMKTNS